MPPPPPTSDERCLPAGYEPVEQLGPDVWRARRGGREVALRLLGGERAEEGLAELDVLAGLEAEGAARLLDHGRLPDGGVYVAREWIPGRALDDWATGRSIDELGPILVGVAEALERLHAAGFVHGDLKPQNVVVAADDRPVLMDFGLSGRRDSGSRGEVAGTLFFLPPEQLTGAPPDVAGDLFSLGVLMHQLLVHERPSARSFYARFPGVPFLDAAETPIESLPTWARDVVERLLSRRPEERPRSAGEVARSLRSRLGMEVGPLEASPLVPPITLGREAVLERWIDEFDVAPSEALALTCPSGEDSGAVADAVRLRASLRGVPTRAVDLEAALAGVADARSLDAWALELAREAGDAWMVVSVARPTELALRALRHLARARTHAHGRPRLSAVGELDDLEGDDDWSVERLPGLRARDVEAFLADVVDEPDRDRLARFADALARTCGGTVVELRAVLAEAQSEGLLLEAEHGLRLRPGPLPTPSRRRRGTLALPEDPDQRRLLFALALRGDNGDRANAGRDSGLARSNLSRSWRKLLESGWVRRGARGLALAERPDLAALLPGPERRAFHARRVEQLVEDGAPPGRIWVERVLADPDDRARRAELEAWFEARRGASEAELALATLDDLEHSLVAEGYDVPPFLVLERAFAWAQLGQAERARRSLDAMRPQDDADRARAEIARAHVARLEKDLDAARAHLEHARRLDPGRELEAQLGAVQLAFDAGDDTDVVRKVDVALAEVDSAPWRLRCDLGRTRALSRMRRGEVEAARDELEDLMREARERGDDPVTGTLLVNLGTLERRTGSVKRSVELFDEAARVLRGAGWIAAEATARGQLGGALRELGAMQRAEEELRASLEVRLRLGDEVGARTTRSVFALLLAERGHAAAAAAELERAIEGLTGAERLRSAPLLMAALETVNARLGREATPDAFADADAAVDPRVFLERARSHALRGAEDEARSLVERAAHLAHQLSRPAVVAEASLLQALLDGDAPESIAETSPALVADARLVRALRSEGEGPTAELRDLAERFATEGRDDRAARAWLALARREPERAARAAAREVAEAHLSRCNAGLDERESFHLRRSLLAFPDPEPRDLDESPDSDDTFREESEMEILSLLEINHRLVEQEDLRSLLSVIVTSACTVTGAERGFLVLEQAGELRIDVAADSAHGDVAPEELHMSTSAVREALTRMEVVNASNALDDPLLGAAPSVVSLELRSILAAPFQATDELRGVIVVDHRLRTGAFGPRAERLLKLLADQAALAIAQVTRMERIQDLADQLSERVARQQDDLELARRTLRRHGLESSGTGLVGSSPAMSALRGRIERVAPTPLPVLVRGASGTGKELAARALHDLSDRRDRPFVGENVAALPESLIESELFGSRKGAFTGADRDREGLVQRADGGTLFLDEIGEMPKELQAKLLRVLETRRVRRLGDDREIEVDFRLVTATHRDLQQAVAEGRFREDLYYRLAGVEVVLPSLAERAQDIPELVEHFLALEAESTGTRRSIAPAVIQRLVRRPWPGNVRELRNEVSRLLALSAGDVEDPELVSAPLVDATPLVSNEGPVPTMAELERAAITKALEVTGDDKRAAAELLGISRAKIYQRLKEWRADA